MTFRTADMMMSEMCMRVMCMCMPCRAHKSETASLPA